MRFKMRESMREVVWLNQASVGEQKLVQSQAAAGLALTLQKNKVQKSKALIFEKDPSSS
ncbi:MAG TPA: hypothetical protein VE954_20050 [Oligoflexus sp.]|nr:hypothetical protein [Oligoflexus sp.]